MIKLLSISARVSHARADFDCAIQRAERGCYKAVPTNAAGRHDGALGGASGAAPGGRWACRIMAKLVYIRRQQTEAWPLREGSLPLHLPHHQPGQLRVPRTSALPRRAALPLLAPGDTRYVRSCETRQELTLTPKL